MLRPVVAPDPPPPPRGLLVELYSNGSENMHHLRDQGWVHLKGAVPPEKVAELVRGYDDHLEKGGFRGRFGKPSTIDGVGSLPEHMWGIDVAYLPFSPAAWRARNAVRTVFANEAGVDPESQAGSIDGTMAARPDIKTDPPFDPTRPRLPTKANPKTGQPSGPGHVDQCPKNSATADSQQCFLALSRARLHDLSTVLLVPRGKWTIQGMMDAARAQFPKAFQESSRQGDGDGMFFPPHVQEWLVQQGVSKAIKPDLDPGDILIWSSALPHCAGAGKLPRGGKRNPRLGQSVGFFPADRVSAAAKAIRWDLVAMGRCSGQQVHRPQPHLEWPPTIRRTKGGEANWPPVYKGMKRMREEVKAGVRPPAHVDAPDDSEDARANKRLIRSLLG